MRWYETIRLAATEGWHASFREFDKFERTKDIGFHFGTKEQADYFSARPYKKKFLLDLQNPIRLSRDWNQSHPEDLLKVLGVSGGPFDQTKELFWELMERIKEMDDSEAYAVIRDKIIELGYDGIVYPNEVEGSGDSYVVFFSSQATPA